MKRRSTREEWAELLALKDESDKSIKAFCEEFGVPTHQFYYWRKRLRQEPAADAAGNAFVKIDLSDVDEAEESGSGLTLDLRRLSLQLEPNFDAPTLRRVLAIAAELRC